MARRHDDRMRDMSFRFMALVFRVSDFFVPKKDRLADFGIREGDTIVDYGCGPGRYLEEASTRVGLAGRVYAVDIHELAVQGVERIVREKGLANVVPVLARGYACDVLDGAADLVYALDMFHGVSDPRSFLVELRRIAKPGAALILEDGHQSRKRTKEKLALSSCWRIEGEEKSHVRCVAV